MINCLKKSCKNLAVEIFSKIAFKFHHTYIDQSHLVIKRNTYNLSYTIKAKSLIGFCFYFWFYLQAIISFT